MNLNALFSTASNLFHMTVQVGCGEVVARYNRLTKGTGALAGVVSFSIHQAFTPLWTAIHITAGLNPLGQFFLVALEIIFEAVLTGIAMVHVFHQSVSVETAATISVWTSACSQVVNYLTGSFWTTLQV